MPLVPPAIVLHQVTETPLTQSMTCLSGLVHPLKAYQKPHLYSKHTEGKGQRKSQTSI